LTTLIHGAVWSRGASMFSANSSGFQLGFLRTP